MTIRLVKIDGYGGSSPKWKIERRISIAFDMWENYYYPRDIVFLSQENAEKAYDDIKNGRIDKDRTILKVDEV